MRQTKTKKNGMFLGETWPTQDWFGPIIYEVHSKKTLWGISQQDAEGLYIGKYISSTYMYEGIGRHGE